MLFKTLADRWILDRKPRLTPRSLEESRYRVRVLCGTLGNVSSLNPDQVQAFIQARRKTCSIATVNGDLGTLRAILS